MDWTVNPLNKSRYRRHALIVCVVRSSKWLSNLWLDITEYSLPIYETVSSDQQQERDYRGVGAVYVPSQPMIPVGHLWLNSQGAVIFFSYYFLPLFLCLCVCFVQIFPIFWSLLLKFRQCFFLIFKSPAANLRDIQR